MSAFWVVLVNGDFEGHWHRVRDLAQVGGPVVEWEACGVWGRPPRFIVLTCSWVATSSPSL